MSPVVRVVPDAGEAADTADAAAPAAGGRLLPRRVALGLGELVLAARLAGDVPLPVRTDRGPVGDERLDERLTGRPAGTPFDLARVAVATELRRAADDGPGGARASLVEQRLLDGDRLDAGVIAALHVVAGAPVSAVLDVTARRRAGEVRLRAWFGIAPGLVAQLAVRGPADVELAWFDPRLWVSQLTRAVSVAPWVPEPAPMTLPDHVSMPTELLAGSQRAHREQRTDLLAPMAAAHLGDVLLGGGGEVRAADTDEVVALLRTLGSACRGRLRLLTTRRDREATPAVAAWLLLDDGWHELRPGPRATSVLRRRDARDLGLVTLPLVESVVGEGE